MLTTLNAVLPGSSRRLAALGALQSLCAVFEATTIALLIPFLTAVGSGRREVDLTFFALLGFPSSTTTATAAAVLIGAVGGRTLAQVVAAWYWSQSVFHFERQCRTQLVEAFVAASWDCQSREPAGKLQQLLTTNAEQVAKSFTAAAYSLTHAVSLVVLTAYAFTISLINSLGALVVLVVLALAARPLSQRTRAAAASRADALVDYTNLVSQGVALTKELRIFGVEPWFTSGVARLSDQIGSTRRSQNFFGAVVPVIYQNGSALLLIAGALLALLNDMSAAATSAVVSVLLLIRAVSYGQHLHLMFHQLQECIPYLDQLASAQSGYGKNRTSNGSRPIERVSEVAFDDVSYSYDGNRPALSDISFRVTSDDVVAVVGPSGAGKSTLAQLLLGLRSPQHGSVHINGILRDEIAAAAWFARVAFVPQDLTLFGDTIEECIRFHRPGVSSDDVRQAARRAGILNEIELMPMKFETLAGERGGALSYGQRQRVCIARALVNDPDLLVFDEPTSALDPNSEAQVLRTIRELRGKKITFILAHRAATLGVCNKVLVLHDGRLTGFHNIDGDTPSEAYYRELVGTSES